MKNDVYKKRKVSKVIFRVTAKDGRGLRNKFKKDDSYKSYVTKAFII
jgi:hypothetical protein